MPYQINTAEKQSTLRIDLSDSVTMAELERLNKAIMVYLRVHRDRTVNIVLNIAQVKEYPHDLQAVQDVLPCLHEPNVGFVVEWSTPPPDINRLRERLATLFAPVRRLFRRGD